MPNDLAVLEAQVDSQTVLVTHSPARGILDMTLLGHAGSVSIAPLSSKRNVRAHIHGHIHSAFGRNGRHFNVAAGQQLRAVVLDLETLAHEVVELR